MDTIILTSWPRFWPYHVRNLPTWGALAINDELGIYICENMLHYHCNSTIKVKSQQLHFLLFSRVLNLMAMDIFVSWLRTKAGNQFVAVICIILSMQSSRFRSIFEVEESSYCADILWKLDQISQHILLLKTFVDRQIVSKLFQTLQEVLGFKNLTTIGNHYIRNFHVKM